MISTSTRMTSKCHTIFNLWPLSGCSAVYWALAISALVFMYQYHSSVAALYSQLETSIMLPTTGSTGRQPQPNGKSPRAWRVATFLVFISQTYLAIFAALFTYSCIHELKKWALRQESGSRPVIMQVFPPQSFPPKDEAAPARTPSPLSHQSD